MLENLDSPDNQGQGYMADDQGQGYMAHVMDSPASLEDQVYMAHTLDSPEDPLLLTDDMDSLDYNSTRTLDPMNDPPRGEDYNTEVVTLVLMEMAMSFGGILCNLLVVTTIRSQDDLQKSSTNLLLANLCLSNIIISFLVKPISAIYAGYAVSIGQWQVGLTFCSLYTVTYRSTWCVFPFSLVTLCWLGLFPHVSTLCVSLRHQLTPSSTNSSHRVSHSAPGSPSLLAVPSPLHSLCSDQANYSPGDRSELTYYCPGTVSPVPAPLSPDSKRRLAELSGEASLRQRVMIGSIWVASGFFGIATCFPEKIIGLEMLENVDTGIKKTTVLVGDARQEELTVCTIKTGVNDFLDYITVLVTLFVPVVAGPVTTLLLYILSPILCPAPPKSVRRTPSKNSMVRSGRGTPSAGKSQLGVSVSTSGRVSQQGVSTSGRISQQGVSSSGRVSQQGVSSSGRISQQGGRVTPSVSQCGRDTSVSSSNSPKEEAPSLFLLTGFTIILLVTYTLHMIISELIILDSFTFLVVKNSLGFMFIIFIPILTVIVQPDIKQGIGPVFGSRVICKDQRNVSISVTCEDSISNI